MSATELPPAEQTTPASEPTASETTTEARVVVAAAPYTYDCFWKPDPTIEDVEQLTTTQITEAWHLKNLDICSAEMDPSHKPSRTEAKALALLTAFNTAETKQGTLEILMGICADRSDFADQSPIVWNMNMLASAVMLCPKAPHAAAMRARGSGAVFDDGTYVVGTEVKPGTYRTGPGVRDCYWERTTDGGGTIANDFVTFAPKGVTVTIRKSDGGFTSTDCGVWKRVS